MAVWSLAGFVLCSFSALVLPLPTIGWMIWGQVSWLVVMGLYLWVASQACRFLVDARRSGLLELLLVTPLSSKDIVEGQWRGLLRSFGLPALVVVGVQAIGVLCSQTATMGMTPAL